MSRLTYNSPLLKAKSHTLPHLKHIILLYMIYRELKSGWTSVTTHEISKLDSFNLNKANQILRRLRDYDFIKGHKQVTTVYKLSDRSCKDGKKTIVVKGKKIPDPYTKSDIIEKVTRNTIQWALTERGREYATRIWYESDRYKLTRLVSQYERFLLMNNFANNDEYNKYFNFINKKDQYIEELEKQKKTLTI